MKYNYSKALSELRSKLDISQTELASLLGVVYASVNRWENNIATPTKIVRVRIEKIYKEIIKWNKQVDEITFRLIKPYY